MALHCFSFCISLLGSLLFSLLSTLPVFCILPSDFYRQYPFLPPKYFPCSPQSAVPRYILSASAAAINIKFSSFREDAASRRRRYAIMPAPPRALYDVLRKAMPHYDILFSAPACHTMAASIAHDISRKCILGHIYFH